MITDFGGVRERARLMAGKLSDLFLDAFPNRDGVCLVALAGLGRGEIFSNSDADLMIFYDHENPNSDAAQEFTRQLWSHLDVPIAAFIRSPKEVEHCLQGDLAGTTALLEGAYLAGDKKSFQSLQRIIREDFLPLHGERFQQFKLKELEERHGQDGEALSVNEPDLKQGLGGFRDLQLALMLLALEHYQSWVDSEDLVIIPGLRRDHLEMNTVLEGLTTSSHLAVDEAQALLDRTREALNKRVQRERLLKSQQQSITEDLGYEDKSDRGAVESFMTDLFHARRLIFRVLNEVMEARKTSLDLLEPVKHKRMLSEGIFARGDELDLLDPGSVDATALLELFSIVQKSKRTLSTRLCSQIREEIVPGLSGESFQTRDIAKSFCQLLTKTFFVAKTLRLMHEAGVLEKLIPAFGAIDGLSQFDAIHSYTVEEQTLRGLRALEGQGSDKNHREAQVRLDLLVETERRDLLRLAFLLHDVGKARGLEDHEARGEALAREVSKSLFLSVDEMEHVSCLVREHNTLPRLSKNLRINDEGTIVTLLEAVSGDLTRLEHLYLLSSANCSAIAPGHLTHWQDNLMTSLYELALESAEGSSEDESRAELISSIVRLSPPELQNQLRAHLKLCPSSYLVETDSVIALEEMALIQRIPHAGFAIKARPDEKVLRITVASRGWGHRFAHQTGVLSALAFSIHGATTWTRLDGIGLDRYIVEDLRDRPLEQLKLQVFETLQRCRRGQVDISKMVGEASRAFSRRRPDDWEDLVGSCRVDNEISDEHTLIEVTTRDRLGLLYTLLRTFDQFQLTVHFTKISTEASEVVDTFYVTRNGEKLEDELELERLKQVLLEASGADL
ncbi:MAG: HD domain-containing protein [Planctomycetota bacterium]|nr:HD domain-containing protein [Planctomycetota bacterium]